MKLPHDKKKITKTIAILICMNSASGNLDIIQINVLSTSSLSSLTDGISSITVIARLQGVLQETGWALPRTFLCLMFFSIIIKKLLFMVPQDKKEP
jgi:hypothetical protein